MTGCASADPFVTAAFIAPYLGIEVDSMTDAQVSLVERSGKTALALIQSYLRYPIERHEFTLHENHLRTAGAILVNRMPLISVDRVVVDGVSWPRSEYTVDEATAVIKLRCCMRFTSFTVDGEAGYATVNDMPPDMAEALASITVGIYNRSGNLAMPAAADTALKSLTMFDAMSMSFDQAGSIEALSPQKLIEQWAFVLNQYRLSL